MRNCRHEFSAIRKQFGFLNRFMEVLVSLLNLRWSQTSVNLVEIIFTDMIALRHCTCILACTPYPKVFSVYLLWFLTCFLLFNWPVLYWVYLIVAGWVFAIGVLGSAFLVIFMMCFTVLCNACTVQCIFFVLELLW